MAAEPLLPGDNHIEVRKEPSRKKAKKPETNYVNNHQFWSSIYSYLSFLLFVLQFLFKRKFDFFSKQSHAWQEAGGNARVQVGAAPDLCDSGLGAAPRGTRLRTFGPHSPDPSLKSHYPRGSQAWRETGGLTGMRCWRRCLTCATVTMMGHSQVPLHNSSSNEIQNGKPTAHRFLSWPFKSFERQAKRDLTLFVSLLNSLGTTNLFVSF